ncbi:hypothetical protein CVT24_005095, partial [Panaeolus cyanescens]
MDKKIRTDALVDSGATSCYINERFVDHFQLPTSKLPNPIGVYNADGSRNSSGSIERTCTIPIRIGSHREDLKCFVVNTGTSSIILGHSWLVQHNPHINWKTNSLRFQNDTSPTVPTPKFFYDPISDSTHVDGREDEFVQATAEEEWHDAIVNELGDDGDALMVVDMDSGVEQDDDEPYRCQWEIDEDEITRWKEWDGVLKKKERVVRLRGVEEGLDVGYPERYFLDFKPVFEKETFDRL